MAKIKIIATIGPSSCKLNILKEMKKNGMNIARINTKHSPDKEAVSLSRKLKKIKCPVMMDIKDNKKIDLVNEISPEYVAVSFAENSRQIKTIKNKLKKKIKIISKIETKNGIKNIKEIIKESYGLMVARGDLSKNIKAERVPIFQKLIIKKCNKKNKFVITATEMLLSLMKKTNPEKSEVSDIANAVLDGSNALMLSEETAIGKHPILSVKTMRKIINETINMKNKSL